MREKICLKNVYDINKHTRNYIIDISVEKYINIFNNLDNAPLKIRDINKNIQLYLDDCSSDIPIQYGIDINFYITEENRDEKKEKLVVTALESYYLLKLRLKKLSLKDSYINALIYILISFLLLLIGFALESKLNRDIFCNTMLEGVNIGGWIFLWEAISLIFFKLKDTNYEIDKINRFLKASISFTYRWR